MSLIIFAPTVIIIRGLKYLTFKNLLFLNLVFYGLLTKVLILSLNGHFHDSKMLTHNDLLNINYQQDFLKGF